MRIVDVPASGPYKVEIGSGAVESLGERVRALSPRAVRAVVVSDDHVFPLYGERVLALLRDAGLDAVGYVLPHGEASKNTDTLLALLNFLTEQGMTRSDVLIALGGGMIGDLTGFAAAVYMRGIGYYQVPSTLLAAVDSSVGGKTAVDLPAGKNLMGAFWQPRCVLCDTDLLDTLPGSVFIDGCAEVIKTALAREAAGFDRESVIARCVELKRDVVAEDEFDRGRRGLLNLGHTLGHAAERCSAYMLSHGRAVAIGTAVVCRASARAGLCEDWLPKEVSRIFRAFGLPVGTRIGMEELLPAMLADKKRSGGVINVVVTRRVGLAELVPMDELRLKTFMESGLMP